MAKHQVIQDAFVDDSISGTDPQFTDDNNHQVDRNLDNIDSHRVVMLIEPSRESISSESSLERQQVKTQKKTQILGINEQPMLEERELDGWTTLHARQSQSGTILGKDKSLIQVHTRANTSLGMSNSNIKPISLAQKQIEDEMVSKRVNEIYARHLELQKKRY